MPSLVDLFIENYQELVLTKKDPIVDSWVLMQSPYPIIAIVFVYLYVVLDLGPNYMRNRQPYGLKNVLIAYNGYQVLFNVWLCIQGIEVKKTIPYLMNHLCRNPAPYDTQFQHGLAIAAWWFFFSKIVELFDTVFFVLRKKDSQVTFLHVYHHASAALFSWAYLKFLPAEQGVVIGFLNAVTHVIMYSYYLVTALGPKFQKFLWVKRYITTVQLVQFCLMLVYLAFVILMDCKFPKFLSVCLVANAVIFLYLFSQFYRRTYSKPKTIKD